MTFSHLLWQIFLESELFYRGIRPAINVRRSVSRVGLPRLSMAFHHLPWPSITFHGFPSPSRYLAPPAGVCASGIAQVEFSFNMYGAGMGTLALVPGPDSVTASWASSFPTANAKWSRSGNRYTAWEKQAVALGGAASFAFVYTYGSSDLGDAAVGDVYVACAA